MKKLIGIVYEVNIEEGLTHDYFASVLEGFRWKCNELNHNIVFLNQIRDKKNKDSYMKQVLEYECSAVLLACTQPSDEITELVESGIAMATIDMEYENAINVKSDNVKGMGDMMEYLISRGHRRMAIILGDDNLVCSVRLNEFLKVCENHGIKVPRKYILRGRFRDINGSSYLTESLLKMPDPPSCILYSDDYAAIGGMNAIRARGLVIPDDISITGYDGNDILTKLEPKITTVYQDTRKIGNLAAEKLIDYMKDPKPSKLKTYVVETSLKVGRTVGRVYDAI